MTEKPIEPLQDPPAVAPVRDALLAYGDVPQATVVQPIVLPDGRTAYVTVNDSSAVRSPYGQSRYRSAADTAPEPSSTFVDTPGGLILSNATRPARVCRPSLYAAILPLNCLAFIFSILSIAAPFAKGYTACEYSYYWGSNCVWRDEYVFAFSAQGELVSAGAVNMAIGFLFFIPTLVLSAILFHKRDQEVAAGGKTIALCAISLVSVVLAGVVTVFYFVALYTEFDDTRIVIGPVMALLATVLYLAASILLHVALCLSFSFT
ncbi:hypothetical protein AGDE_16451 [Angomonas deanei]|uniref:Amastin surface glycoprotein n=1 Tax=Angomonas deanei TaxID=59799 RepID=A0A7G2C233_9TRYP|nr:hypothetical protein AGDE_16451 [Angomonas deanei]CAD2213848.1 hypothetical protein, conserved [Angomonas deanei]|eukprot:EPY17049.1 hypothetical protein AGDE_16451 [Angomonas deanei]